MLGLVMKVARRWLIIVIAMSAPIISLAAPVGVANTSPLSVRITQFAHVGPYYVADLEEPKSSNQVVNVPADPGLEEASGQSPTPYSGGNGSGGGTWLLYVGGGAVVLIGVAYFAQGQKK